VKARAAKKLRINDDSVSGPERVAAGTLDDVSNDLVSHDARVGNGDRAIVDLQIRPTHTAVTDLNQNLASTERRASNLIEHQFVRCF
jgi:hypothetical protein